MRIAGPAALLVLAACSSSHTPDPDPTVGPANTVRVAGTNTTGVSNNALRVTPSYDVAVDSGGSLMDAEGRTEDALNALRSGDTAGASVGLATLAAIIKL